MSKKNTPERNEKQTANQATARIWGEEITAPYGHKKAERDAKEVGDDTNGMEHKKTPVDKQAG
jgi:hypothetical protein